MRLIGPLQMAGDAFGGAQGKSRGDGGGRPGRTHELRLVGRSTNAYDRLAWPGGRGFEVELKAKHQRYVGWSQLRPEVAGADLLILDELALRQLVDVGRYAFLLVRDVPSDRWVSWSLTELVVCSKTRVTRQLSTPGRVKGKVLVTSPKPRCRPAEAGGDRPPSRTRAVTWIDRYLTTARPKLTAVPDDGVMFLTVDGTGFLPGTRRHVERANDPGRDLAPVGYQLSVVGPPQVDGKAPRPGPDDG